MWENLVKWSGPNSGTFFLPPPSTHTERARSQKECVIIILVKALYSRSTSSGYNIYITRQLQSISDIQDGIKRLQRHPISEFGFYYTHLAEYPPDFSIWMWQGQHSHPQLISEGDGEGYTPLSDIIFILRHKGELSCLWLNNVTKVWFGTDSPIYWPVKYINLCTWIQHPAAHRFDQANQAVK